MDISLQAQYLQAIFRFKKAGMFFPQGSDINMTELVVMRGIAENISCADKSINVPDIQRHLHITKAAISQTLNLLEKKGYIIREIDKTNRRKIAVILTQRGLEVLKETKAHADRTIEKIISRFGENNIQQLITLLNRFSDISDEIKRENKEGDV